MRLWPRFSLRSAWIGLTIFLLGFGFWACYWKRESEHREIVARLKAAGWKVEEEPVTLLGIPGGHRLVGLTANRQLYSPSMIGPLLDLPRPWELKRLQCQELLVGGKFLTAEQLTKLSSLLQHCSELEQLHLHNVPFGPAQVACLSQFRRLQVLDLQGCVLPRGALARLPAQPQLETLLLTLSPENADDVYRIDLPRLRVLYLTRSSGNSYSLTHDGFGRFPCLETLVAEESNFEHVRCEAGAMPRLKHLSLDVQLLPQLIDWENLPAAVPALEEVALYWMHYRPGTDEALRRCKNLRRVHLPFMTIAGDISKTLREILLVYQDGSTALDHPRLIEGWREWNPAVKFNAYDFSWSRLVLPAGCPRARNGIEPWELDPVY
jgi:hypothetical protein